MRQTIKIKQDNKMIKIKQNNALWSVDNPRCMCIMN